VTFKQGEKKKKEKKKLDKEDGYLIFGQSWNPMKKQ
jgi:hypothetical protein